MIYTATIQWSDNGNIQDDMVLKIGEYEENDDDVFFYFESQAELERYKKEGEHDWFIVECQMG
jgi:hypothetical protein